MTLGEHVGEKGDSVFNCVLSWGFKSVMASSHWPTWCFWMLLAIVLSSHALGADPGHVEDEEDVRVVLRHPLHWEVVHLSDVDNTSFSIQGTVYGISTAIARGFLLQIFLTPGCLLSRAKESV